VLTTHPSLCRGQEWVELYLYSPSRPLMDCIGWPLPLHQVLPKHTINLCNNTIVCIIKVVQPAYVHSSNPRLSNQEDEKIYCATASSYMWTGLTRLSSIQGLNSTALECRCSFVYRISNVGFSQRWLLSLARGSRHLRTSIQSSQLLKVNCRVWNSSYRTSRGSFYSTCIFSEKESWSPTSV
jgi:hypothetical protein